jgi:molybdopterin converting factor small subunit
LEEVTSITNLLERVGLGRNLIAFAVVNGVRRELNCILQNNDTVALFPYVIGG